MTANRKITFLGSNHPNNKWHELRERNEQLRDNNIPSKLLIVPLYRSRKLADLRIRQYLDKSDIRPNTEMPLNLKAAVCMNISEYGADVLNAIGRSCVYLGGLGVRYYFKSKLDFENANKADEISVFITNSQDNDKKFAEFSSDKSRYGFFKINLDLMYPSPLYFGAYTGEGHAASGFVDNLSKTIYIYNGASWINFAKGIEKLDEYFKNVLPNYKLEIIAKSHQTKYATCNMFQPVVTYLMMLYNDPKFICDFFDKLTSGDNKESVVDMIAMSIEKYHASLNQPILTPSSPSTNYSPTMFANKKCIDAIPNTVIARSIATKQSRRSPRESEQPINNGSPRSSFDKLRMTSR